MAHKENDLLLRRLAKALRTYTNKNHKNYDPEFDKAIRKKHPRWFVDLVAEKKRKLLAMNKGSPRPTRKHPLGLALLTYTAKGSGSYDQAFHQKLAKKHPQWFIKTSARNKEMLLAKPKGSPKPHFKRESNLNKRLKSYTNKKSATYDRTFDEAVRKKHPRWFVDTAEENKERLLSMPKGASKPKNLTFLRRALDRYSKDKNHPSYDVKFSKAIRKKHPLWFVNTCEERVKENKRRILSMPRGTPKPRGRSETGARLYSYTYIDSKCYDPDFDKAIKAKQPQWFHDD